MTCDSKINLNHNVYQRYLWDKGKIIDNMVRQVTAYLKLINPDYKFWSVMIRVLLLLQGNYLGNMVVAI
jgi:hypothetical protein